jgi:hypothetical protein
VEDDRPTATKTTDRRPAAARRATVRGATGKARAVRLKKQLRAALEPKTGPAPKRKRRRSPAAKARDARRAAALAEREAERRALIAAPIVDPPNPLLARVVEEGRSSEPIEPGATIGNPDHVDGGADRSERGAHGPTRRENLVTDPVTRVPDPVPAAPSSVTRVPETVTSTPAATQTAAPRDAFRLPSDVAKAASAESRAAARSRANAKMADLAATFRARGAGRRTVSTVLSEVMAAPAPLPLRREAAKTMGCTAAELEGLSVLEIHAGVAAMRAGTEGEWWDRVHDRLDPKKRRVEHTGADGGAIRTELLLKSEMTDRDASDVYRALLDGGRAVIEDAEVVEPRDASSPEEGAS